MSTHAVTVLGRDRPGIIAEATARLADLGLNLEDSTMTLLRGHFAMVLVVVGEAGGADVEQALASLAAGGDLTVAVRPLPAGGQGDPGGPGTTLGKPWVLTVHGADRPGIVSAVVGEVARAGGNVTDLSTRLTGELYLLVAEVDLPVAADAEALAAAITAVADGLGVSASLRPAETDEL